MTTKIRTSSEKCFTKIKKYLSNKRVFFTSSLDNDVYTLTIDLSDIDTSSLINEMTQHLHLNKRQEPKALAA